MNDQHVTGVFHPTHFDGYTARCSCGWSGEEMGEWQAAELAGLDHMIEHPVPDEHGNSLIDFSDGTVAIHTARGWFLAKERV